MKRGESLPAISRKARAQLAPAAVSFLGGITGSVDTVELFHRLLQEKICLTPGALYTLSDRCNNALRLSCCYPFDERYTYALKRTGALACEMSGIAAGIA